MRVIDSYRSLVAAMAENAMTEYRKARRRLEADPEDGKAKSTVTDVREFLESDWFRELLDLSDIYVPREILEETGR